MIPSLRLPLGFGMGDRFQGLGSILLAEGDLKPQSVALHAITCAHLQRNVQFLLTRLNQHGGDSRGGLHLRKSEPQRVFLWRLNLLKML